MILHKGVGVQVSLWAATTLHIPSAVVKIIASCKVAVALSVPAMIITYLSNWSLSNQEYIAGVLACIAIDHIIGSIYHAFWLKDFTLKRNAWGLINKLLLCAMAGALFEIIHNTVKEVPLVYEYLKVITRLIVILYPAGSAFMNMSELTNGVFPPIGWIRKIKSFNENLDIEKFKNDKTEEQ